MRNLNPRPLPLRPGRTLSLAYPATAAFSSSPLTTTPHPLHGMYPSHLPSYRRYLTLFTVCVPPTTRCHHLSPLAVPCLASLRLLMILTRDFLPPSFPAPIFSFLSFTASFEQRTSTLKSQPSRAPSSSVPWTTRASSSTPPTLAGDPNLSTLNKP